MAAAKDNVPRGLFLTLVDPSGKETSCVNVVVPADALKKELHVEPADRGYFDVEGAWTLRVHSGGFVLAEYDVRVAIKR